MLGVSLLFRIYLQAAYGVREKYFSLIVHTRHCSLHNFPRARDVDIISFNFLALHAAHSHVIT